MNKKNNESDIGFMKIAIAEAIKAKTSGDLPFGAVIVCENIIISKGHAQNNTTGDVTDHAELMAIREACKNLGINDLKNCTIYCTNEPCIMCAAGIFQAGIAKVVIGVSRGELPDLLRPRKLSIEDLAKDSSYPIEMTRGLLKDDILSLFLDIKRK